MPQRLQHILPLLILVAAFLAFQNWARLELLFNPIDSSSLTEKDVVMYTTSWCPYCAEARRYLNAANVPFTEYDIEQSPQAYQEYERLSGRGVPVMTIGDTVIQGYNPGRIRQAIDSLQAQPAP